MRIWDCHCHCRGEETGEEVLRAMDQAGIERINLFARYPAAATHERGQFRREDVRASVDHIAAVQSADPSRIFGLLWIEPRADGMLEELERGIVEKGLRGAKMMPDHWSPTDESVFPFYEKMRALGRPIQFHSGILYGFGDSSRFCRPVLFEALVNFPGLRFSLAHIGWPWVDECLAVFGRFRAAGGDRGGGPAMWIDTCRGTPDAWREEALRKAVPFCGVDYLMFGVDASPKSLTRMAPEHVAKDEALLRNVLGLSNEQVETYFWGAAERFYGP